MRLVYVHQLIALLLIAGNAIICAQIIRKDLVQASDNERDRRAVDFGFFVRNLLLKSATASNAKANIAGNVLNLKTTTSAPRRRTTTTTTAAPFFKFPFDLSGHINKKFNNGGYINFDYNDYGGQQPLRPGRRRRPTTTTTSTTTTTAAPPPPPTRRRPIPRRPYGLLGKQHVLPFDYYDDYDYNYDDADNNPPASTAAPTPAPRPNPTTARPQKRPLANRARAQGRVPQLRNRFVYQFRQPDDTSINNDVIQPAANTNSQNTNSNNGNDEASTNRDDVNDDGTDDDASNVEGEQANDVADDDTNADIEQDYNDSSDNANPNTNSNLNNGNGNVNLDRAPLPPPNSNFNFNTNLPPFPSRLGIGGNLHGASGFDNFGNSRGFQYSPYNDFNLHNQPSSPAGYSVRYY